MNIRYSPGLRAFILEEGELFTTFEDELTEISTMLNWLRRRAIRQAAKLPGTDEPISPEELARLVKTYIEDGGQVTGKIKHIDLEALGL